MKLRDDLPRFKRQSCLSLKGDSWPRRPTRISARSPTTNVSTGWQPVSWIPLLIAPVAS